ncbi:MAG TPA: glucosaminidase domain-containing protein [Lachnospiraceae bacterium]|nr:glucosaminidase domain-containing protein [Lachnospiraceae bacterium]
MTKDTFITQIGEAAQKDWPIHNVLPSLIIAQAILESSWGDSALTQKGNNLFGIKAGPTWHGQTCTMRTAEQRKDGSIYHIDAAFRSYDSWLDCIKDHGDFLKTNRYTKVRSETNYKLACRYIQEAGYATDIHYSQKLINLIETYRLNKFDSIAIGEVQAAEVHPPKDNSKDHGSETEKNFYTVKKGDSLTKIASQYHTTVNNLVKKNNITDPNKIYIGQRIEIE